MLPVYRKESLRRIEQQAAYQLEDGEYELMQRAGRAAFQVLLEYAPYAKRIAVICGPGNKAGDGFVFAKLAQQAGIDVVLIGNPQHDFAQTPAAKRAYMDCQSLGLSMQNFSQLLLDNAEIIIDAMFGIGLNRNIEQPWLQIVEAVNASGKPVLSLDIPSGVEADTGRILGTAIQASITVSFIALKPGLVTGEGVQYRGQLINDDLLLTDHFSEVVPDAELIEWKSITHLLPQRSRVSHKGNYGHVLVIGGDYGMGGAVRLAAEAALRVGAGLVSVATRPEHVSVVNTMRPEIMCHQVSVAEELEPLLKKASVVVIGPGLGQTEWAKSLLTLVMQTTQPKVVDADALNLLATTNKEEYFPSMNNCVLTPHPGEASRLLSMDIQGLQRDRLSALHALQTKYGATVVLKGAGTLIQADKKIPCVCVAGNPGMATAGMGDVLSGVIGGLLAQGLSFFDASCCGVQIHAMAADMAAEEGGERGLIACDLLEYLRQLVNPE